MSGLLGGLLGPLGSLALLTATAVALLLLEALARADRSFGRPIALVGLLAAGWAAWPWIHAPELDGGSAAFGGSLSADHLSALVDLLVVGVTAAAVYVQPGRDEGSGARPGAELGLLVGAVGASALAHAGDLIVLVVAAELAAVGATAALLGGRGARGRADAARRHFTGAALSTVLMVLGVALLYAALASTSIAGIGGRIAAVFNQWGAVQKYLVALESGHTLPAGLEQQFVGKVVTGAAPGNLFIAGLLVLVAGTLGKLLVLPFMAWRLEGLERAEGGTEIGLLVAPQLAWLAVMARVFVGQLHAGRLVNEPYGWNGALPTVALLTALVCHWLARTEPRMRRRLALGSAGHVSLGLLAVTVAANFHGHRVIKSQGVGLAPSFELLWAHLAGDAAVASLVLVILAWTVAVVGALSGCASVDGAGPGARLDRLAGLWVRDRGLAVGLGLCFASLAALPPTGGFVAVLAVARNLAEHSSLDLLLVGLVLAWGLGLLAFLEPVRVMWRHREAASPGAAPGPSARRGRAVSIACGLLSVALGLGAAPVSRVAQICGSGLSMSVGSQARAKWVAEQRERWDAEAQAQRARAAAVGRVDEATTAAELLDDAESVDDPDAADASDPADTADEAGAADDPGTPASQ